MALATTGLAPGLVAFAALLPLLLAIDAGLSPRAAALHGWLGGMTLYGVGLAWAPLSGIRGAPLVVVAVYVLVIGAALACYAGALAWLRQRDRSLCFALAPALWIALEYARSRGSLGYPWQQLGYALADHPALLSLAASGGIYALSLWIVSVQSALVALRARPVGAFACAAALGVAPLALAPAASTEPHGGELRVAAVQPHVVETGHASDAIFRANLRRLLELSEATRAAEPDLLVWPESAYERTLRADVEPLLDAIAREHGVPLLTGLWRAIDGEGRALFNSALLADPERGVAHAGDKVHPVPFWEGEPRAPLERALASVLTWPGAFRPGAQPEVVWLERGGAPPVGVGVLICLDSSYPELARDLRRRGASVLVEVSNEALTGPWSATQHARVSRLRAVETGLPLVRVANIGPSEWIDPSGRVLARLPAGEAGAAAALVPLGAPPAPYVSHGDGPVFAASLLPALALVAGRRMRARRPRRSHAQPPCHEVNPR